MKKLVLPFLIILLFGLLCGILRLRPKEDNYNKSDITTLVDSLYKDCGERVSVVTGESKYIIIRSLFFGSSSPIPLKKYNAAILVTDTSELRQNELLFFNNRKPFGHACGYHYTIDFWSNPIKRIKAVEHNIECEGYCFDSDLIDNQINKYARLLQKAPTHYIYNIEISTKISPDEFISTLKNSEIIFSIEYEQRFTSLDISFDMNIPVNIPNEEYYANLELNRKNHNIYYDSALRLTKEIQEIVPYVDKRDISANVSGYLNGIAYFKGGGVLYFENGTDLSDITNILEKYGAEGTINIPDLYSLQLLDTANNIEDVKRRMSPYKSINRITEYNPYGDTDASHDNILHAYDIADTMPQYSGGDINFRNHLTKKVLAYQQSVTNDTIKGRIVLRFIVTKDGDIDQIKVLRGIDNQRDSVATDAIKTLPFKFTPGKLANGEKVNVYLVHDKNPQ